MCANWARKINQRLYTFYKDHKVTCIVSSYPPQSPPRAIINLFSFPLNLTH
jgi:hypothetical protein